VPDVHHVVVDPPIAADKVRQLPLKREYFSAKPLAYFHVIQRRSDQPSPYLRILLVSDDKLAGKMGKRNGIEYVLRSGWDSVGYCRAAR
jgi:hypothetical protein